MRYYEVFVNEARYIKNTPLTYSSDKLLKRGTLVTVPFGNKEASGFIAKEVALPSFETKTITTVTPDALPVDLLDLHSWTLEYYPYGSGPITKLFIPSGIYPAKTTRTHKNDTPDDLYKTASIQPDRNQTEIIKKITELKTGASLIHGETGSGKTTVYGELIKKELEKNKSTLLLVPEISLIKQTSEKIKNQIGMGVINLHSGLKKTDLKLNWLKILRSEKPTVAVGTRLSVFAPIKNLGLIVIDEMHETTYKQDSTPRYNALRVAAKRSALNKIKIVYGSATPSISEYYLATKKKSLILRLPPRENLLKETKKTIVDIKDRTNFTKQAYLSNQLIHSISNSLKAHTQTMLIINRRGTAKQIICSDCGWIALCPKCDIPLTLHGDKNISLCHVCGYKRKPYYSCPVCESSNLNYRSFGTKSIVEITKKLFPDAIVKRFDTDNTEKEKLNKNLTNLMGNKVNILVGTQMLSKGLDLPKLALVGIINADTALSIPDFSSSEKNYQMIHQSIGRVGRGHIPGEVIIQTYRPNNTLLRASINQDWLKLYDHEIKERVRYSFPPHCFIMKISVSRKKDSTAKQYLDKLRGKIIDMRLDIAVGVPVPRFYSKSHGYYNWNLIIKSKKRTNLIYIANTLASGNFSYDIDPTDLL